jgi:uncharacterized membrane protein YccC
MNRLPRLKPAFAIFSINSFAAAMLALYIGFSIGLPRPYWAMLTVYITAQPLTGALRSKALFRVLGTGLGATAAIALIPPLANAPVLLSLAMAGWAGLCLYLSLLDRTPRAYVFMLAGYTAAIIGFPSVNAPGEVFETGLARVEEIVLGIGCATVVHSVVFPRDVAGVLNLQAAKYLKDARDWIGEALAARDPQEIDAARRRRLASDVTELQILATHLPFDTSNLRPRTHAVRALQDRLALLLPLLTGVEDRVTALRADAALPPEVASLLPAVAAWTAEDNPPREASIDLIARCAALTPAFAEGPAAWAELLTASAMARLGQLIEALQETRELVAYLADPRAVPAQLDPVVRARARRPLHRDHGLAALSAFALAAAVLACCAFWWSTAWPEGAVAAMMAAVFASFFATQDDPAPALIGFLGWTLVALPIAALYLFAILPAIDGFPLLALSLLPVLFVLGYLQADPSQYGRAMPLIIGFAGALSLQEVFTADFPSFVNASLAQIVGIGAALSATRLFRTLSASWSARRLLRRGWRALSDLAAAPRPPSAEGWTSAMLDRLGLVTPRLAVAAPDEALQDADVLVDLRLGLNLIDLKGVQRSMPPSAAVDRTLEGVSTLYARRAAGRSVPDAADTLKSLDAALGDMTRHPRPNERRVGLIALTGLRRTLYPEAPPPVLEGAA